MYCLSWHDFGIDVLQNIYHHEKFYLCLPFSIQIQKHECD